MSLSTQTVHNPSVLHTQKSGAVGTSVLPQGGGRPVGEKQPERSPEQSGARVGPLSP